MIVLYYTFGVNTQTELNAVKRKSEKTERELSNSRTKSQQLATKHEEMTVSQLHCTVAHRAGCYMKL